MKLKRTGLLIFGGLFGLLLLLYALAVAASPTPLGAIARCMPFGWVHFLRRNIVQLTFNWGLIRTGLICSVLAFILGHWLLSAIYLQVRPPPKAASSSHRWRLKWTLAAYCGIWVLFITAFGASGLLRHTTWLMQDDRPWYQERIGSFVELRMADGDIAQLVLENNEDLELSRKALLTQKSHGRPHNLMADEFDVIFYGNQSNKVAAYLIIPRGRRLSAKDEFGASIPGAPDSFRPVSELQRTIAELDKLYSVNEK